LAVMNLGVMFVFLSVAPLGLIAPRDGGENRHEAFCFGHAAHALRTWGVFNSSWGVLVLVMGRFAASPGG